MLRSLQKLLDITLEKGKAFGIDEVFIKAGQSTQLEVKVRNQKSEQTEMVETMGFTLKVFSQDKSASIQASDISDAALLRCVDKIISLWKYAQADKGLTLPPKELFDFQVKPLKRHFPKPFEVPQALEKAKRTERALFGVSNQLRSDGCAFGYSESQGFRLNSHGFQLSNQSTSFSLSAVAIAEDGGLMETDYDYDIALKEEDLKSSEQVGVEAARLALRKLNAKTIKTQTCPVIFSNRISSTLISHLLSSLSGMAQYRKKSFFQDGLGKLALPPWVSVVEDPFIDHSLYSKVVDAEGLPKRKQHFVKSGKIERFATSHYSATKINQPHSANAGGFSNILVELDGEHQNRSFADLIKAMGTGLVITELMGSSINANSGDYSRGASGFWVQDGMIVHAVKEITIAGNLKDMYQKIVMIGRDIDQRKSIKVGSIFIDELTVASAT